MRHHNSGRRGFKDSFNIEKFLKLRISLIPSNNSEQTQSKGKMTQNKTQNTGMTQNKTKNKLSNSEYVKKVLRISIQLPRINLE